MSYYMQPKTRDFDSLDIETQRPFNHTGRFMTRDPMKLSDIDGAKPAQIPGYTGSKAYSHMSRHGSVPNFGPTKAEIDLQWKSGKYF